LLKSLPILNSEHVFQYYPDLINLPLFYPAIDQNPLPQIVIAFREKVRSADAIIISTPSYLHNIPAVLKNSLEWLSSSGELQAKRVLALTYTPQAPRGEKAMLSLTNTLKALNARIITTLELYYTDIAVDHTGIIYDNGGGVLLEEAIHVLQS
ncbi:MAG: NADPH-dependent FMN reductase, partial [Bacteroidota bacterium]